MNKITTVSAIALAVGLNACANKEDVALQPEVVYKTEKDTRVWVHWNGNRPPTYNVEHGYLAVNIHTLRSNFDLVKA